MNTERFYLECPYAQKDEAKANGARWDPDNKKWYVPSGLDKDLFRKWWPVSQSASMGFEDEIPF